jgi:hypothetical protein
MLVPIRIVSRSLQTRLFAAVLLLPLVALATATSGAGLRCRITGEILNACCCAGDAGDDSAKANSPITVSAAGCCDRVARDVPATTAEVNTPERVLPEHATPMPAFAADLSGIVADASVVRARPESRASLGPPTVRLRLLAKSTFLI